uniref:Uncharacterized protein n=1 Tax=Globisporangium ultimum (strain ATCC 200006 / CBS 805.95 / DAOM BR144) TaxID=431595 RepID=K3WER3_GLOUD
MAPSLVNKSVTVMLFAIVVRVYWNPQEALQLLGSRDVDLLAHVVRFMLTMLTYCFATAYVSWFFYLGGAIFIQSACWVLYISKDRYLEFLGLDETTEKEYLMIGASICYAVLAAIIFFGGDAEERYHFRNRLTTFYEKHNPEKIKEVDALVKKYEGNEKLLFTRLHRKYNALSGEGAVVDGKRAVSREFDESDFLYEEEEEDVQYVEKEENAQEADNEESANEPSAVEGSSGDSDENDDGFQVVKAPLSPVFAAKQPSSPVYEAPGTPPGRAFTSNNSSRIQAAIEEARRLQEERIQQRIAQLEAKANASAQASAE